MKKNKILTLVALGTLSVGVVAGGVALSTNDNLAANAGNNPDCTLKFDWHDKVITESSSTYAQDSTLRLFLENGNGSADKKCFADLATGGSLFLDGTAYDAAKGWGSIAHGIETISISFKEGTAPSFDFYTSNTSFAKLAKINKDPLTSTKDMWTYNVNEGNVIRKQPNYFKLVALNPIEIDSISINCTADANPTFPNLLKPGVTYKGALTNNAGEVEATKDVIFTVANDYSIKLNLCEYGSDQFETEYTFYANESDPSGGNYVDDLDSYNPNVATYLNSGKLSGYYYDNSCSFTLSGIHEYSECKTIDLLRYVTVEGKETTETAPAVIELGKTETVTLKAIAKDINGDAASEKITWTLTKTNSLSITNETDNEITLKAKEATSANVKLTATCENVTKTIELKVKGDEMAFDPLFVNTIYFNNETDFTELTIVINADLSGKATETQWGSVEGQATWAANDVTILNDGKTLKIENADARFKLVIVDGEIQFATFEHLQGTQANTYVGVPGIIQ